jgi:adenylosuccinate lyase
MREGNPQDLVKRLSNEKSLNLTEAELNNLISDPLSFVGLAERQVSDVVEKVAAIVKKNAQAANYSPQAIL